jgi:hypothetical protein
MLPSSVSTFGRSMRHPIVKTVGFVLFGLLVCGLVVTAAMAVRRGAPFIGENYMGLPIGTYSTLAVLIAGALIGSIWLVQRLRQKINRRRLPS